MAAPAGGGDDSKGPDVMDASFIRGTQRAVSWPARDSSAGI